MKAMREKFKKKLGQRAADDADEGDEDENGEDEDEEQEEGAAGQIDKNFEEVLNEEYADDQIGDPEGDLDQGELIGKDELDDAVNEFIESQRFRDWNLFSKYKDDLDKRPIAQSVVAVEPVEDGEGVIPKLVPILKTRLEAPPEAEETPEEKQDLISKSSIQEFGDSLNYLNLYNNSEINFNLQERHYLLTNYLTKSRKRGDQTTRNLSQNRIKRKSGTAIPFKLP